ncbi:MAG: hypothetical protein R2705_09910 [Ilumatobacteraceae bacterium]
MFDRKPMAVVANMPDIDFDSIYYYIKPTSGGVVDEWDALPEQMKATYEKLGIPEAERKYLAGVTAQYESEVVYHNRDDLGSRGSVLHFMDTALLEVPELVKQYFGTVIPPGDNKFAALNTSVWSGGSFIYVPPGVEGRDATAGVLPDQLRERRAVRADADHRRRGLRFTTSRDVQRRCTPATRSTRRSSRSSSSRVLASPTPRSRTGHPTSTTW